MKLRKIKDVYVLKMDPVTARQHDDSIISDIVTNVQELWDVPASDTQTVYYVFSRAAVVPLCSFSQAVNNILV